MTPAALGARIARLEAKRPHRDLDGLTVEQLERSAFGSVRRMVDLHGGLDEMLASWDRGDRDPKILSAIRRIREITLDVRSWYLDLEARLCTPT